MELYIDFKTPNIEGVGTFYREAGDESKPTIVLLHGFPSSSSQFRDLIPRMADRFHLIAPDYPGMGFSGAPAASVLRPTFDDVARVIDALIVQRTVGQLVLYLHDIGGPIGMRIAMSHPERIAGLIFQNFTLRRTAGSPSASKSTNGLADLRLQRSWPRLNNLPPWNAACFSRRRV